jgi:hypothetical protein
VIDPGPLRVDGWSPRQIGDFFLQTIGRYAREAWFIDGWEYSSGATKDYLHCATLGIPCFAENGKPLDPNQAVALLASAVEVISRLDVSAPQAEGAIGGFPIARWLNT